MWSRFENTKIPGGGTKSRTTKKMQGPFASEYCRDFMPCTRHFMPCAAVPAPVPVSVQNISDSGQGMCLAFFLRIEEEKKRQVRWGTGTHTTTATTTTTTTKITNTRLYMTIFSSLFYSRKKKKNTKILVILVGSLISGTKQILRIQTILSLALLFPRQNKNLHVQK